MTHAFYMPADFRPTSRFYIFDLDGTIAISKSGRPTAHDAADTLIIPSVPKLFDDLRTAGNTILIVSNQAIWSDATKEKIQYIFDTLKVPVAVATGIRSPCRKPNPLIWWVFCHTHSIPPPAEITMVGDAVGPTDPYPPYRWASSDAEFAANIGAKFVRPCDIIPRTEPMSSRTSLSSSPKVESRLILMVGNPGSGKSTFARKQAEETGAEHIEQDTFSSRSKVLAAARAALRAGRSVIIDATHGNRERRNEVYALAAECGVEPHVVWLPRDGRPFNKERTSRIVPGVAYGMYVKHFSDPREDGAPVTVIC